MSTTLFDDFMEVFYSFRLGNTSRNNEICLYSYKESSRIIERKNLPEKVNSNIIRIIIISDTHQRHRTIGELPSGDIFIHSGDIMMTNRMLTTYRSIEKLIEFNEWLNTINCKTKIIIGGNHDKVFQDIGEDETRRILTNAIYLQNNGVIVDSLKIWGTPLSNGTSGNSAFQSAEFRNETHESLLKTLNEDGPIDIFVSHGPNFDLARTIQPRLHVWGHAHGSHGIYPPGEELWSHTFPWLSLNASIMNTKYNPHQNPIVLDIEIGENSNTLDDHK